MTIITNEWIAAVPGKSMPWAGREVLCRLCDGSLRTLVWNGWYWVDPVTNRRQLYDPGKGPTHFYIFEKFIEK